MNDEKPVRQPYTPFKKSEPVVPPQQPNPAVPAPAQQPPVQQPPQQEKKKKFVMPRINKEFIRAKQNLIVGGIFAFVFLIILIAFLPRIAALIRDRNPLGTPAPSPTEEPAPTPSPGPSQYADDEDVKTMESDIDTLSNALRDTVIREDKLRIPDLDFNVSFKK